MKKYFKYIMISLAVVSLSSCEKFLDINKNPNSLTSATPALILPQAITNSALIGNNSSQSMSDFGGYQANAGGFGGFGSVVTYDFGTGNFNGLWVGTYDNANDFEYILTNTSSNPVLAYSTAIARIMKSMDFERLVNQYNDAPYSDALKGSASLQPKYDKAEDIYKACIAELNKAIADITTAQGNIATEKITASSDPLFSGDMDLWKKYANTIKLRMLIKMAGVPAQQAYATAGFSAIDRTLGFLTTDAINQPTYEKTTRPSPVYSSLGFTATGTNVNTSRIPTKWIFSFYNGIKISDPARGAAIYRNFPSTPTNQLGDESAGVPAALAAGSAWFTGTNTTTSTIGVVKGPGQGVPVMLAAESYFLQAEAFARNYLTGDAAAAFQNGVLQSFTYLYKNASNVVDPSKNPAADVATYMTENAASPLVNFNLAVSLDQKIEAIITQKYIAFNMINNDEGFNEFRRTSFPKIENGSLNPTATFASRQSISTRSDKLPSRILYPQQEYNLNPNNAPSGINKFTSRIFWDLN
ncbi:SusD/RagB family nutrient-binding outer membrane lipoprotein [Pedobacter insulae]|uniref:Starch-binding associating with outer membrane n=1 Tax=Pedobacter insulae TaxID=414048 RepID=A0A1I2UTC9_9SPHI|nr:SusD/RagB family nutrient-binding outer membrane lipoprotein [Pedobacter insulae]SFG80288.1 Starch-binding associating with outer membrane [Pedobacter insulae]